MSKKTPRNRKIAGNTLPMPYPSNRMTYVVCTEDDMLNALRSELGELYHSPDAAGTHRNALNQQTASEGMRPFVVYGLVRITPKRSSYRK